MNLKREVCKDYMLLFRFETFASERAERLQLAGIQPHPDSSLGKWSHANGRGPVNQLLQIPLLIQ
jgi:hypothetical protein